MRGAAIFGFVGSLFTFFFLSSLVPQPLGAIALWCLIALLNASAGVLTWRRTRLPWATASMLGGASTAALVAWLHWRGFGLLSVPMPWAIVVLGGLALSLLLLPLEARFHPAQWAAWREAAQHASFWDFLRGRHIPHLR
jgi:hypothetical protein